jgi:DNA-binding CsgD family transcriptional regulator
MSKSASLRSEDVRAIVQLVGECRDLGDDPVAWRQHLFRTVSRLSRSVLATGADMAGCLAGRTVFLNMDSWGWENGLSKQGWLQALTALKDDPTALMLVTRVAERLRQENSVSYSRKDVLSDREWEASADYNFMARVVGVNHSIGCFRSLPPAADLFKALCLWRAQGDRDYSPRDRLLVQEALAAVVPLVGGPLARPGQPSPAELPPRVRQALRCLLDGDGDKQIARRLGLTRHTVNEYMKTLFRYFGVQSRTELLARWVRRGFPNRFSWGDV